MFDSRKLIAEFIGTAILVFVAVGTATLSFGFKLFGTSYSAGVVTTALAFGLVLMALVYAIGPISGCHVNPAVSLGFVVAGPDGRSQKRSGTGSPRWPEASPGPTRLWAVFNGSPIYSKNVQGLGADGYGSASKIHLGVGSAFAVEAILTFIFVMVILFATSKVAREAHGRPGHRRDAGLRPPGGHRPHRHRGQPGPQHRPGPGGRWHRAQPALAVHRGPAGRWVHRRHGLRAHDPQRDHGRTGRRRARRTTGWPADRPPPAAASARGDGGSCTIAVTSTEGG